MDRIPNTSLLRHMREAGWSDKGAARRVNEERLRRGRPTGYCGANVRGWLRGVTPEPLTRDVLAHLLAEALGRPITPVNIGFPATAEPEAGALRHRDPALAWDTVIDLRRRGEAADGPLAPAGPEAWLNLYSGRVTQASASVIVVTTTTDSEQSAVALAASAVEAGLAACGQVGGPIRSIYRWAGAIEDAPEWTVTFKTDAAMRDALVAHLRARHGYETPEILTRIAGAEPDYAAWVTASTGASKSSIA